MSYFTVDPSKQRSEAEESLRCASRILESAIETYEKQPSRVNRIALVAAQGLVKESKAKWEEWK